MSCLPSSRVRPFFFDLQQVRVVIDERGAPWFVAADVCAALTVGNPSDAVGRLDADERGLGSIETPSGTQQMVTVSEPGLYSLVLGSRKPEAKRFKRWVTHDVLPAIRETGSYSLVSKETAAGVLATRPNSELLRLAADLAEENERQAALLAEQQKQLAAQAPAVDLATRYLSAEGDRCLTDAATALCIPPKTFTAALVEEGFCYRRKGLDGERKPRLLPHAEYVTRGFLVNRARLVPVKTKAGTVEKDFGQTMVTPAGMAYFHERFAHLSTRTPEQQSLLPVA